MKQYILLRNNLETGPHSLEQLGSIGLFSLDLIWIENESTSWSYPEEIDELKNLLKHDLPLEKNLRYKVSYLENEASILSIQNLSLTDAGIFKCKVQNQFGNAISTSELQIQGRNLNIFS